MLKNNEHLKCQLKSLYCTSSHPSATCVILIQLGAAANKSHTEVWALQAACYPNVWMIAEHIGLLSTTDLHSNSYLKYCSRRAACSSEYFAMTAAYTGNTIPQGFPISLAFSTVCSLPLLVQSLLLSHLYKLVSDWISNLLTDRIIDIMLYDIT